MSSSQLEESRWRARYDTLMEQHQGLDLTMTKLDNHCEVGHASPRLSAQTATGRLFFL